MFARKPESRTAEDKLVQGTVLQMPERARPLESVRPSAPAPSTAPVAREGSVPHAVKSSLISEGFEFTGDMKSDGSLTVDGAIKGNLVVKMLLIGATGLVDGSVKAENINVEGSLSGAVECDDLVIGERAVVDGKLNYASITIQRGATIKGELKRAQPHRGDT